MPSKDIHHNQAKDTSAYERFTEQIGWEEFGDFTDIVRSDNQMLLALAGQMNVSAAEVRAIITAAIARTV